MAKYIDCDYVTSKLENHYRDRRDIAFSLDNILFVLKKCPAADVVEVKHGEWISEGEYLYKCSLCGDKAFLRLGGKPCKYCPNCGAEMDLEEGAEE